MKEILGIFLAIPLTLSVGCVDDGTTPTGMTVEQALKRGPLPTLSADREYVFFKGHCNTIQFPGYFTPQAETFFIWNLGTSIQHGAAYPSNKHAKLYGVFAPGPAGSTHHVDGFDQFDHYHIISNDDGSPTFDVELVFPGPNFNAATWVAPLSTSDLNAAVAAGTLGTPLLTTQAGFDPLVFKVPVSECE